MNAIAVLRRKAAAASSRERAIILAGFAVVSALLTTYAGDDPWRVLAISLDKDVPTQILPGIYFGLVLASAIYFWTTKNAFHVFAVLVITILAWIAAHQTAVAIFRYHELLAHQIQEQIAQQFSAAIKQYRELLADLVAPDKMPEFPMPSISHTDYQFAPAVAGVFAGLVGSAITAFGVSVASAQFRSVENWMRTLIVGTVAGALLYCPELKIFSFLSITVLFLVWQPAVAASIGYGLAITAVRADAKRTRSIRKPRRRNG